jgi:hypothetical protein
VTRDRVPSSSGSTVMLAFALSGPSTPRAAKLLGGESSVISCVDLCSTRPIRRVVVNLEPTLGGWCPSIRTLTTSSCHSANREGSVAYEKTSSGGRAMKMVDTIGGIASPTLVTSADVGPSKY